MLTSPPVEEYRKVGTLPASQVVEISVIEVEDEVEDVAGAGVGAISPERQTKTEVVGRTHNTGG